jgi:hypothetical protein
MQRSEFLSKIDSSIKSNGYHVTMVTGGELPRFAYTIGCKGILSAEFVFAGGEFYSKDDVSEIISQVISGAKKEANLPGLAVEIKSLGRFSISEANESWSELLLLGAFDYYKKDKITVWQILPDASHFTLDVPDMSQVFDIASQSVWQWLSRKWDYPVPNHSMAVTNLKVLFGEKAAEVVRWEVDEWEIFSEAGSDIAKEDMRIVPLGLLIGIDKSLEVAVELEIGKGVWRDSIELEWNDWGQN